MWYNAIFKRLLRSPLHGLASGHMLLIAVTGRNSGRQIETPISYLRQDDVLWVTSRRERTWWRNLRGGARATVWFKGQRRAARGEVFESDAEVAECLAAYLRLAPQAARFFQIALEADQQPRPADVARAARNLVMVKLHLD